MDTTRARTNRLATFMPHLQRAPSGEAGSAGEPALRGAARILLPPGRLLRCCRIDETFAPRRSVLQLISILACSAFRDDSMNAFLENFARDAVICFEWFSGDWQVRRRQSNLRSIKCEGSANASFARVSTLFAGAM